MSTPRYAETREFDILLLMAICDLNINEEVVFAAVVITVYVDLLGNCYCFKKHEVGGFFHSPKSS